MSGLGNKVQLEVKSGKIIISKVVSSRKGWGEQIRALVATEGDPTGEFADMNIPGRDGLEELEWDGVSFEEWQKGNAKLS